MQHESDQQSRTFVSPTGTLYSIGCDLQEEGNLGRESADFYQRTIEEMEGDERGNPWAIAAVWLAILSVGALLFVALIRWIF